MVVQAVVARGSHRCGMEAVEVSGVVVAVQVVVAQGSRRCGVEAAQQTSGVAPATVVVGVLEHWQTRSGHWPGAASSVAPSSCVPCACAATTRPCHESARHVWCLTMMIGHSQREHSQREQSRAQREHLEPSHAQGCNHY